MNIKTKMVLLVSTFHLDTFLNKSSNQSSDSFKAKPKRYFRIQIIQQMTVYSCHIFNYNPSQHFGT